MPKESADALLIKGLKLLELPSRTEQIKKFLAYLVELKKWNRAHSLTSLRTDRDIIVKHFLDSLLFLCAIPAEARSLADIGSGAGFPGIPVKIMLDKGQDPEHILRPGMSVVPTVITRD